MGVLAQCGLSPRTFLSWSSSYWSRACTCFSLLPTAQKLGNLHLLSPVYHNQKGPGSPFLNYAYRLTSQCLPLNFCNRMALPSPEVGLPSEIIGLQKSPG